MNHPSSLIWFRHAAKDLHPWEVLGLRWHTLLCLQCNARLARENAALRDGGAPPLLPGISARAPTSPWLGTALAGAIVAFLAILVVQAPEISGNDLRSKGGSHFNLWIAGEPPKLLGRQCSAGQRVQPLVESQRRYLIVIGVDTSGATEVLYPFHGESSASIPEGKSALLNSWTFDGAGGTERFIALFSDQALNGKEALNLAQSNHANPDVERIERSCVKSGLDGGVP